MEVLHSGWGFWAHLRKKRTKNQPNKKQLRNYCMKENFNSDTIMWRNKLCSTAEGAGGLEQCSYVRKHL